MSAWEKIDEPYHLCQPRWQINGWKDLFSYIGLSCSAATGKRHKSRWHSLCTLWKDTVEKTKQRINFSYIGLSASFFFLLCVCLCLCLSSCLCLCLCQWRSISKEKLGFRCFVGLRYYIIRLHAKLKSQIYLWYESWMPATQTLKIAYIKYVQRFTWQYLERSLQGEGGWEQIRTQLPLPHSPLMGPALSEAIFWVDQFNSFWGRVLHCLLCLVIMV